MCLSIKNRAKTSFLQRTHSLSRNLEAHSPFYFLYKLEQFDWWERFPPCTYIASLTGDLLPLHVLIATSSGESSHQQQTRQSHWRFA